MRNFQNDPNPNRVNIELPNGEIISVAKAPLLFVEDGIRANPKAKIKWENNGMSARHRRRIEKIKKKRKK